MIKDIKEAKTFADAQEFVKSLGGYFNLKGDERKIYQALKKEANPGVGKGRKLEPAKTKDEKPEPQPVDQGITKDDYIPVELDKICDHLFQEIKDGEARAAIRQCAKNEQNLTTIQALRQLVSHYDIRKSGNSAGIVNLIIKHLEEKNG